MKVSEAYKCENCGRIGTKSEIEHHEKECIEAKERAEKAHKIYQERLEKSKKEAVQWAENSESVLLLCRHGFTNDARVLCDQWAKWNLWDCGSSCVWEEILDKMVDAAVKKENRENEHS